MANGNNNGQIVPFKDKVNNVRQLLEQMKGQLAMALPAHIKVERFLRVALTAVQKMPDLLDCYQPSFLGALVEAAQLGLEVNTNLGHAWLIPFWNSKQRRLDCQLVPGYKGLIKLAYQSGVVTNIRAHVVRERDDFSYEYGLSERLVHKPYRGADGGPMVATYAVCKIRGVEEPLFRVLERWECEQIRDDYSKSAKKGPWVDQFDDMCMKSVARRLLKWAPSDTERNLLARAVDLDERAQAGIGQELTNVIDIAPEDVKAEEEPADSGATAAGPAGAVEGEQAQGAQAQGASAAPASGLDKLAADAKAKREGKGA